MRIRLAENDDDHEITEQAEFNPPVLTVLFSIIVTDDHAATEDQWTVGEAQTMLPDIGTVLLVTPDEPARRG